MTTESENLCDLRDSVANLEDVVAVRRPKAAQAPLLTLFVLMTLPALAAAQAPSGEAVYKTRCAACHDNADGRTPSRQVLQGMTPSRILRTLDFGAMMTIAYTLRRDEREAVSRFLGKPGPEPSPRPEAYCADRSVTLGDVSAASWNGWSPTRDNRRFVPASLAGLTAEQVPRLRLKWAFGFDGDISAFAQPTIIGRQVFVGSAAGTVYALRADTGCIQWTFQANGPIRSAIVATPFDGGHRLVFGDLTGWLYAIDAANGRQIWRVRPEEHEAVRLSAPPIIHEDLVIVPVASWEESRALNPDYPCCTFRGSVTALRLSDGSNVWKRYMVPTAAARTGKTPAGVETFGPSGVGIWGSPTVDAARRRLYVTTGNNYSLPATTMSDAVVALDLDSGAIVWSHQALPNDVYNSACSLTPKAAGCPEGSGPDYDFGAPAILVTTSTGRDLLLAGQKAGIVWALDPDRNGAVVWQSRVSKGGINGGVQWGMASDGQRVYAATSDVVITRTATSRSVDPTAGGGVTALRVTDGSVEWHAEPAPCAGRVNCSPAQLAAVTAIPGVVFSGSLDGHLRAHSATDGKVLWDYDTVRDYQTVNGVKASGGAIDGPGPVIANGMVLVNSGYTRFGGIAGNVLLAFAAD
jgi:polyvinyl alcohol dehydrogenase (cytochrome)